jgi:hypothetical protein
MKAPPASGELAGAAIEFERAKPNGRRVCL